LATQFFERHLEDALFFKLSSLKRSRSQSPKNLTYDEISAVEFIQRHSCFQEYSLYGYLNSLSSCLSQLGLKKKIVYYTQG